MGVTGVMRAMGPRPSGSLGRILSIWTEPDIPKPGRDHDCTGRWARRGGSRSSSQFLGGSCN